jgi:sporulation protein YlmC with PRC-barrel domain
MTMEGTTPVPIGADASCTDGSCGTVSRVVVDPVARAVTHLVVEPHHRNTTARLVPIGVVDVTPGGIRIGCTTAEFEALDPVEEKQFVAGTTTYPAYGPEQAIFWPYYAKGGAEGARGEYVTIDAIPLDEVEVRRDEHVHATDGTIGRVKGLVIEPGSRHVTHLLLQEGHPWGRKEVAIPISAVTGVTEGIQLSLTKQQVQDLPPVDIEPPSA